MAVPAPVPAERAAGAERTAPAPPSLVLLPHEDPAEGSAADLAARLVAVLFVAAGPVDRRHVARLLDVSLDRLLSLVAQLALAPPPGLRVQRSGDELQLVTAANVAPVVERYLGIPAPARLSRAALEALAVIAYRQPVTRGEIDAVRGVNSDSSVNTLLMRGLVAEVGRRETVGRPALLATTAECLQYLGLTSLDELPPLPSEAAVAAPG